MTDFRVEITDDAIADLRERLARTRWPEAETVDDWSQGAPLTWVQDLCAHWADGYDFGLAERINAFPQEKRDVDGLGIHFIHARSPEAGALPLVITHGWPGSIVEMLDVIGPLSDPAAHGGDPADAFHVVAPSLPGYGWSDKPTTWGWTIDRIARAWTSLMADLGYARFGAQGGDWGAAVTTALGEQAPEGLVGIHLNMVLVGPDKETFGDLTEVETASLTRAAEHQQMGTGYSKQQSTRPQTLGYGLTDSPAGQAAWIAEKYWAWTDCDGDPERALSKQQMLDNISTYWFTGTAASSARLYWESFSNVSTGPVEVPTAIASYPKEIFRPSRRWAERRYRNIHHFIEHDRGGHFAAWEQPQSFVEDVRAAFRPLR